MEDQEFHDYFNENVYFVLDGQRKSHRLVHVLNKFDDILEKRVQEYIELVTKEE